jgi:hypothetical protein
MISGGSLLPLVKSPICLVLFALAGLVMVAPKFIYKKGVKLEIES